MYLKVISPDKKIFEGNVQKVTLPGSAGSFQVLRNHAPLISTLQKGSICYCKENEIYSLAIEGGLVEIFNDNIFVLLAPDT